MITGTGTYVVAKNIPESYGLKPGEEVLVYKNEWHPGTNYRVYRVNEKGAIVDIIASRLDNNTILSTYLTPKEDYSVSEDPEEDSYQDDFPWVLIYCDNGTGQDHWDDFNTKEDALKIAKELLRDDPHLEQVFITRKTEAISLKKEVSVQPVNRVMDF
jgi:hypothetical protein